MGFPSGKLATYVKFVYNGWMTSTDISAPAKPGASLYLVLIMVSAIGPLSLNIFMPSMPGLVEEFSSSVAEVQLTLSIYLLGLALSQIIYGPLSDQFGRRPLMLAGLALFLISSIFCAWAQSIEALVFWRTLQAIGGASGMVLSRAIIRDLHDQEAAASVIGYVTMAWVLAPMLAPALGGWLDQISGWRSSFWLLSILGGLALAVTFWKLPETNRHKGASASRLAAYANLIQLPDYQRYTLTLMFTSAVFFTFLGGAPYITVVVFERPPVEYGLWFMLVSVGYMLGNFLSGRYSKRFGIQRMVHAGNTLTLSGTLIMAAAVITGIVSPVWIFLPMLIVTLGNGLTVPNGTAAAISVDTRMTGAAAGLAGFMQMVCGALGSQAAGLWQTHQPFAAIWIMAAAALLAAIGFRLIGRGQGSRPDLS